LILSASVNADVPARYGAWFQRRLDAGFLRIAGADPWKQRRIALDPGHIDGIVFWTRNVAPFLSVLDALHRRGTAFIVHYALTAEAQAHSTAAAIAAMQELARRFGPRVVVWRYDPMIADERKPADTHVKAFTALASALAGVVDEVIVAFARQRLSQRSRRDPAQAQTGDSIARRDLVRGLSAAARERAMRLSVCADADALAPGSSPARCIDARRLADIAGRQIDAPTAGFMRDCLCARAIDIGDHGGSAPECFCGADARRRPRLRHDRESEYLFEPVTPFKLTRPAELPC
jgi:hypothetical protein